MQNAEFRMQTQFTVRVPVTITVCILHSEF
jgi:hypothetical protein